jgi:hypothetical protein
LKKKQLYVLAFVALAIGFASIVYIKYYSNATNIPIEEQQSNFVGSQSCVSCHASVHNSFVNTAHFNTSADATVSSIKGSFDPPYNEYQYNQHDKMIMEKFESGFFQTGYSDGKKVGSQRFDIVIGSGTKGQTYLNWIDNKLVQLPVSYYVSDSLWSSSPGYPPDRFVISRPIRSRCLSCHSTFFNVKAQMGKAEEFDKLNIIFGVDCERCHGPASRHVDFHAENPAEKGGKYIIRHKSLTRKQQLHACAQCHSSSLKMTKAPFTFFPGDVLFEDFMALGRGDTSSSAEVHGNQYDLLTLSKCFLKSDSMTCSSCHNTHIKERDNLKLYSERCQSCHQTNKNECTVNAKGFDIQSNCVDCHMPKNLSSKISFRVEGKNTLTKEIARTHFIKVYPNQAKKLIDDFEGFLKSTHAKKG